MIYEELVCASTYIYDIVCVDLDCRIGAQSFGSNVLLQLGVDPIDGHENGERGPEGKTGYHGKVGLGQVNNVEAVLRHELEFFGLGLFVSLSQNGTDRIP